MILKRIILVLTVFLLLCLIVNFSKQTLRLWQAGRIVEVKKNELEVFEKINLDLKKELEEVKSLRYVEEVAREKLGMAKEGEKVVILPINTNSTNNPISTNEEIKPNWRKWWGLFIY